MIVVDRCKFSPGIVDIPSRVGKKGDFKSVVILTYINVLKYLQMLMHNTSVHPQPLECEVRLVIL